MSEPNVGSGDRRTPPTEDDRATAEMTAVGRQGAEGSPRSAPQNGQRPATPQPSASGWTPPPLPGRQTPQPPAPRPAGQQRPVDQPVRRPEQRSQVPPPPVPAARPAPAQAAPPQARPAPAPGATAATLGRPGGLPLPTPAPERPGPTPPPAAAPTDAAPGTAAPADAPRQQSFWQRVTDGLGLERKPAGAAAPSIRDDAAAPAEAPAAPTPQFSKAGAPEAPSRTGSGAAAATTLQQNRVDGRAGGPENRTVPTAPGDLRPGQPAPGSRPGSAVPSGAAAAATAIAPTTAGQGPGTSTEVLASGPKPGAAPARRTRKARLRLSRLDPWSVMKTSFLFSIAAGIMLVVAVYAVWAVLSASGLFSSVNDIISIVVSTPGDTTPFEVQDYVSTQRVMGVAALIACVDVLIFTALATLASFLYNLAATMLGGLEITLAED